MRDSKYLHVLAMTDIPNIHDVRQIKVGKVPQSETTILKADGSFHIIHSNMLLNTLIKVANNNGGENENRNLHGNRSKNGNRNGNSNEDGTRNENKNGNRMR